MGRQRAAGNGAGQCFVKPRPAQVVAVSGTLAFAIGALTLASLACLWRAAHMFMSWNIVVGAVRRSGYSEIDQQADYWATAGQPDLVNDLPRLTEDDVGFTDAAGERRVASVRRLVGRGGRPSSVISLWYDPADAQRVTAFGPGSWLLAALACGGAVAGLLRLGLLIARS